MFGLGGVSPLLTTQKALQKELSAVTYLIPNLTRLRPDKFSDEFFVERRLNGFNPGQLKRVEQQPRQYVIRYDFNDVTVDRNGILPKIIEARFCLDGQQLHPHSILKPELGTLDIKTMQDLREMCVYIIYISTFQHSWVNNKQYEDGGDIEYATMGIWKEHDALTSLRNVQQLVTTLNLTSVSYNPIMGVELTVPAAKLFEALWKHRDQIQPGIPFESILMSISI